MAGAGDGGKWELRGREAWNSIISDLPSPSSPHHASIPFSVFYDGCRRRETILKNTTVNPVRVWTWDRCERSCISLPRSSTIELILIIFLYFSGRRKRRINVGLLTWMTLAAVGGHYCHNYYRLTGIPCWVDDSPDSRGPVNKTRWGMREGRSAVCCLEDEMLPHPSPAPHVPSSLHHPPLKAVMFPSLSSSLPWFT